MEELAPPKYDLTLVKIANPSKVCVLPFIQSAFCNCEPAKSTLCLLFWKDLTEVVLNYLHEEKCPVWLQKEYIQKHLLVNHLCLQRTSEAEKIPWKRNFLMISSRSDQSVGLMKYLLSCNKKDITTGVYFFTPEPNTGPVTHGLEGVLPDCFVYDHFSGECCSRIARRAVLMEKKINSSLLLMMNLRDIPSDYNSVSPLQDLIINSVEQNLGIWMASTLKGSSPIHMLSYKLDFLFLRSQENLSELDVECLFVRFWHFFDVFPNSQSLSLFLSNWRKYNSCQNCWINLQKKSEPMHLDVPVLLPPFQLGEQAAPNPFYSFSSL